MKFSMRKKNKNTGKGLIEEARNFLKTIDEKYINKKMSLSCKFFKKALVSEEF